MSVSLYYASIPQFIHGLTNLAAILRKAEAYAEAKNLEPSVLLNFRLYPDMFPLVRHVQIATDIIKGGAARLAGAEVPSYPDTETNWTELQARIEKVITFLNSFQPNQIDGNEEKAISLTVGGKPLSFKGQDYLFQFVIPNVYFHLTVAYSILRHNGLEIGKQDYLGNIQ